MEQVEQLGAVGSRYGLAVAGELTVTARSSQSDIALPPVRASCSGLKWGLSSRLSDYSVRVVWLTHFFTRHVYG